MAQTTLMEIHLDPLAPTRIPDDHGRRDSIIQDHPSDTEINMLPLSTSKAVTLIGILTGVTINGSFSTGLLTVGLPSMAPDLHMPENLLLW